MRSVFLKSVRAFNLALFWSNKEIIHTNKQQNYEKRYKCTILTAETIKMVCCHVNALFEGKKKPANLITFIQPAMLRSPASTLYCILELLYQFLEWVSCTNCYNVPKNHQYIFKQPQVSCNKSFLNPETVYSRFLFSIYCDKYKHHEYFYSITKSKSFHRF